MITVTEGVKVKSKNTYYNFFISNIKVEIVKKNTPKSMTDANEVPPVLNEDGDY